MQTLDLVRIGANKLSPAIVLFRALSFSTLRQSGCQVSGRPGRDGESARQRPATYSSSTGTYRTAIRFTKPANRPARRGTHGIRQYRDLRPCGGSGLRYSRIDLGRGSGPG